jgi:hypothetical protein
MAKPESKAAGFNPAGINNHDVGDRWRLLNHNNPIQEGVPA